MLILILCAGQAFGGQFFDSMRKSQAMFDPNAQAALQEERVVAHERAVRNIEALRSADEASRAIEAQAQRDRQLQEILVRYKSR